MNTRKETLEERITRLEQQVRMLIDYINGASVKQDVTEYQTELDSTPCTNSDCWLHNS